MRAILLLALWAPVALAQGDQELRELVSLLGSTDPRTRAEASRRLASFGEAILPRLRAMAAEDPEIARAVRALLRGAQKLRLRVTTPPQHHTLGADLRLSVEVINDTDETYLIPLVRGSPAGQGTWSAFAIDAGERGRFQLRPDQVELEAGTPNPLLLLPGDIVTAKLVLAGESSPLRKPGRHEISVSFRPPQLQQVVGENSVVTGTEHKVLVYGPIAIEARGRTADELGAALASDHAPRRAAAVRELAVRLDAAILPLLRKHKSDPDLTLIAVRGLGAAAREEDLEFIRDATRHRLLEVRRAAVEALGKSTHPRARRRLIALVDDRDLKNHAVRALTHHKHPATIDCFLTMLKARYHRGEWVEPVQNALYDWTGKLVRNRKSEIAAFDRWWRENRRGWIRANPSGR